MILTAKDIIKGIRATFSFVLGVLCDLEIINMDVNPESPLQQVELRLRFAVERQEPESCPHP